VISVGVDVEMFVLRVGWMRSFVLAVAFLAAVHGGGVIVEIGLSEFLRAGIGVVVRSCDAEQLLVRVEVKSRCEFVLILVRFVNNYLLLFLGLSCFEVAVRLVIFLLVLWSESKQPDEAVSGQLYGHSWAGA